MESLGVTDFVPDAGNSPSPSMLMFDAFSVFQVSTVLWPGSMTSGFAASVAVGAEGAGGAGGVALAAFFPHPEDKNTSPRIVTTKDNRIVCFITRPSSRIWN
jgi:hypothetical protein